MSALPAAEWAAMPRAGTAASQSPSVDVSPKRTAQAEADVAAEVEEGGTRAGDDGNGDGPARVAVGSGAAEAKCDSTAHGEGAQADRAAQAEADCAGAEAKRAQAKPEADGALAEADGARAKADGAADGTRARAEADGTADGARAKVDAEANGIQPEIGDEGTVGGGRSTAAGERGHGGMSDAECSMNVPCTNTGDGRGDVGAQIGKRGREGAASGGRSAAVGKRGRGGTIASEHRHGDGERTCRGDKDARIGAANGNGDGPAHVDGNGVAEAKCDSAALGRGAQADRAAQAEDDCA